MIAFLTGTVQRRLAEGVVLNVQGVGYHVLMPLPSIMALPVPGEKLDLWIYTKVREDAIQLYGFDTYAERQLFTLLIDINGVGPKVALAILSTMSGENLREIVEKQQPELLHIVPGVGKRMADKLVLELHNKLAKFPTPDAGSSAAPSMMRQPLLHEHTLPAGAKGKTWQMSVQQDLQSALENLGYKDKDISPVIQKLRAEYRGEELQQLLRMALLHIGQSKNFRRGDLGISAGEGESNEQILF
jgi:holliday junction DNA helicase RuvA